MIQHCGAFNKGLNWFHGSVPFMLKMSGRFLWHKLDFVDLFKQKIISFRILGKVVLGMLSLHSQIVSDGKVKYISDVCIMVLYIIYISGDLTQGYTSLNTVEYLIPHMLRLCELKHR